MNYYFDDPQRVDELRKILNEWLGTPFRHACGMKKLGVDCIHMVKGVMAEIGIESPSVPKYSKDWYMNSSKDILLEGLTKVKRLELQEHGTTPQSGDIIIFRFGHIDSHIAIYCDGELYHSVVGVGAIKSSSRDPHFRHRIQKVFRVKA